MEVKGYQWQKKEDKTTTKVPRMGFIVQCSDGGGRSSKEDGGGKGLTLAGQDGVVIVIFFSFSTTSGIVCFI